MAARLAVHVTPRAHRDEVVGWRGHELQLRVRAVAEGGKANAAACALVARELRVSKSSVQVTRGHTSRHKWLEIEGVEGTALASAFGEPEPGDVG